MRNANHDEICKTIPMRNMKRFRVAAVSDVGKRRTRNEDSFFYEFSEDGSQLIAAVADGIGGSCGGDIASYWTTRLSADLWRNFTLLDKDPSEETANFLLSSLAEINRRIYHVNSLNNSRRFMGTTIAEAVFLKNTIVYAHAGDSRIYRIRKNTIEQLTIDHNLKNEMIRNGKIDNTAVSVPGGQMLTQAIGPNRIVRPDCVIDDLKRGDRFLLCSDGLTLHMPDSEILSVINSEKDVHAAVAKLLSLTLECGARDNVTMILVHVI